MGPQEIKGLNSQYAPLMARPLSGRPSIMLQNSYIPADGAPVANFHGETGSARESIRDKRAREGWVLLASRVRTNLMHAYDNIAAARGGVSGVALRQPPTSTFV